MLSSLSLLGLGLFLGFACPGFAILVLPRLLIVLCFLFILNGLFLFGAIWLISLILTDADLGVRDVVVFVIVTVVC